MRSLFLFLLFFWAATKLFGCIHSEADSVRKKSEKHGDTDQLEIIEIVTANWTIWQYFQCFQGIHVHGPDGVQLCTIFTTSFVTVGPALIFVLVICVNCLLYWCCRKIRRRRLLKDEVEGRRILESEVEGRILESEIEGRILESEIERGNAELAVDYYLRKSRVKHNLILRKRRNLPDMGSRMQKYWFKLEPAIEGEIQTADIDVSDETTIGSHMHSVSADNTERPGSILTIAPLPRHCPQPLEDIGPDDEQQESRSRSRCQRPNKHTRLLVQQATTVDDLNESIYDLSQHPFIHPIEEIGYIPDRKQVIIIQPLIPRGSLKDMIYKVNPDMDWAEKYGDHEENGYEETNNNVTYPMSGQLLVNEEPVWLDEYGTQPLLCGRICNLFYRSCCICAFVLWKMYICIKKFFYRSRFEVFRTLRQTRVRSQYVNASKFHQQSDAFFKKHGLPVDTVARYGYHILKAMLFLYKEGFPRLGHVQSGNIFVHFDENGKEICKLGGYENTLLGYRSRHYRMCKDHLEYMDVIMFGHLIFEMSCGYELTELVPTEEDYEAVRSKEGGERVEEVLKYIFQLGLSRNSLGATPKNLIKKIKDHCGDFFKTEERGTVYNSTLKAKMIDIKAKRMGIIR